MQSRTMSLILKHWLGPVPDNGQLRFPFHIENFKNECDQLLNLIVPQDRKLFAKQTLLPVGGKEAVTVWKVHVGSEIAVKRGAAIAWFRHQEDLNRFIFGPDERATMQKQIDALMEENKSLRGELEDAEALMQIERNGYSGNQI